VETDTSIIPSLPAQSYRLGDEHIATATKLGTHDHFSEVPRRGGQVIHIDKWQAHLLRKATHFVSTKDHERLYFAVALDAEKLAAPDRRAPLPLPNPVRVLRQVVGRQALSAGILQCLSEKRLSEGVRAADLFLRNADNQDGLDRLPCGSVQ